MRSLTPEEFIRIGEQSRENPTDTLVKEKKSASEISAEVIYSARDSMIIGMGNRKVFLYGDANVKYEQIELSASYIEFDMAESQVFARGAINDSSGLVEGLPVFKDEGQTFNAQSIKYNFKTKKGYIEAVKTKQDEGYLHSAQTRKDEFGHIHMKDGKYTTCDLDHPHYYLALTKAKSIPGDKIISGPSYLVIEDIPIPIGLPFGFFPNKKTNTSGILIPSYGEETYRGFYLSNGGYYWAINDYMDLKVTGDIYTNGTWGVRAGTNYRVRYRFSGNFNAKYFRNITGDKGLGEGFYTKGMDYSIMWSHNQDAKANPSQQFRASVNLSTSKYDQNHSQILTNALTTTKQSSISYQKKWTGTPFNLTASANHSQNSQTGHVDLSLPKVSLNMSTIYPFKSKNSVTKKWYESIQLSYSSNFDNQIKTYDTLLFTSHVFDNMKTGFNHTLTPAYNIKFKKLKSLTVTPNLTYRGVAYTSYIQKYREQVVTADTSYYHTVVDTINKLSYAQAYYPSLSVSIAPKIYGMYQFRPQSKIVAIRHVMSPTVGLNLRPDMKGIMPNYYQDLVDENGKKLETYSKYQNGIYGPPSSNGRSRTMNFALRNTLEAKVREVNDTSETLKKVKILESFNFSTNMNFDDSIKFGPVSVNGSTRLLNSKVNVTFGGNFDPYALDANNRRINVSNYKVTGKYARMTSASLSLGTNFSSKAGKKSDSAPEGLPSSGEFEPGGASSSLPLTDGSDSYERDYYYGEYVNFDIPWSLRADYNLNYSKQNSNKANIIQTLRFSGDFSLTPKWKIGYNTGYDLKAKKVTTSNFSVYRDLHCWEMRLTAVPFGMYKSFNFQINVKSAILQDLKYNKRIPWQDNFR
ncbi:MAG: LPS-assembly protein LptD [Bacteroidales bacterium]|nr:LPS-assembly protein LptD [Bacteroidales bacterium]